MVSHYIHNSLECGRRQETFLQAGTQQGSPVSVLYSEGRKEQVAQEVNFPDFADEHDLVLKKHQRLSRTCLQQISTIQSQDAKLSKEIRIRAAAAG